MSSTALKGGFPILRRIAKNAAEHGVEHRGVFGFTKASGTRNSSHAAGEEAKKVRARKMIRELRSLGYHVELLSAPSSSPA